MTKVDIEKTNNLILSNPDWKFHFYIDHYYDRKFNNINKNVKYFHMVPQNELLKQISKYKVGMNLIDQNIYYNRGMLNLKYFDYLKEGLAIINNSDNIKGKRNVIDFNYGLDLNRIDFTKLSDFIDDTHRWKNITKKFNEICQSVYKK